MEKVKRISISIPEILFREFEEIRKELGERKRSRAISEAIYEYISINRWTRLKGNISGVMVMHIRLGREMNFVFDVENKYSSLIKQSFHARLDNLNYIWLIVFRGDSEEVKKMAREMGKEKSIKSIKIYTVHA